MHIYELSKENIALAKAEAEAILGIKGKLKGNLLLSDAYDKTLVSRAAYTRRSYLMLFSCMKTHLERRSKTFGWQSNFKKDYSLRIRGEHDKDAEKKLASIIWRNLKEPKVNLECANTRYEVFIFGKNAYVCKLLEENEDDFEMRKAHKLAKLHPTAMHPKLARAMVNLTGAKKGDTVYDPFCGSGGLLIEAGLMGMKTKGYDNNDHVLVKCKENLERIGIRNYKLYRGDSLKLKTKMNYISTDMPYGRGTKKLSEGFFQKAFETVGRNIGIRAVIGIPSDIDYKAFLRRNKLREIFNTTVYLHKSLSKRIITVDPIL